MLPSLVACSLLALSLPSSVNSFATRATTTTTTTTIPATRRWVSMSSAPAASSSVVVLGGTGFVGSRVVQQLVERGFSKVVSVSKSGKAPARFAGEDWVTGVEFKALDLVGASEEAVAEAIGAPDVLVSCVGVVGTDAAELLAGNGATNVKAFEAGRRAGIRRAVCVGVASEVAACKESLPDFFLSYFQGKDETEAAVAASVDGDGDSCSFAVVKPTFIYGGDEFGLLPPRVTAAYGSGVEELLTLKPFRMLADATPGLIKVG